MESNQLFNQKQAAEYLGVSPRSFSRLIQSEEMGGVKPVPIGGMIRYLKSDLDNYIQEKRAAA